jgi:uncharacterized protein
MESDGKRLGATESRCRSGPAWMVTHPPCPEPGRRPQRIHDYMQAAIAIAERPPRGSRRVACAYGAGYLAIYGLTLWLLGRREQVEAGEVLFVLVLFGGVLPGITWLLTRRALPLPQPVRRPGVETLVLMAYLGLAFVYLIWAVGPLKAAVSTQPAQEWALLGAKLLVWVALPGFLMARLSRYSLAELMPASARQMGGAVVLAVLILLLQMVVGRGLGDMRASGYSAWTLLLAAPVVFSWLVFEVGVVEEFFFRVLLQSRFARLLRSEAGGIVVASLLFGLVHAPGFYLRTAASMEMLGTRPSVLMAVGYSVVFTSAAGVFLGVLWSRTRNFAAVILVHAAGDLLQSVVPMLRAFTGR